VLLLSGSSSVHPPAILYCNNGDGTFTDITEQAGFSTPSFLFMNEHDGTFLE
jgi:hypothetical protein